MTREFCAAVEQIAWEIAARRFGAKVASSGTIAHAVRTLSDAYIERGADRLPRHEADPETLLARLLFFTIADLPKVAWPLAELAVAGHAWPQRVRIVDVGAGCGTLSLGAIGQLPPGSACVIEAIDANANALALLRELVASCSEHPAIGVEAAVTTTVADVAHADVAHLAPGVPARSEAVDLALAGSVLAELEPARHRGLVEGLLARLAPRGVLIIIEPALRQTARALHALRDDLIRDGSAHLFAPCTHENPCPALSCDSDWCHERRIWPHLPPRLRELAAQTGLRRRDQKFAYLTLSREPLGSLCASDERWRVVSEPIASKGKGELFLCGAAGRLRAVRLKRDRSALNEPFGKLQRGDQVILRSAERDTDRLRIGRQTEVRVL